VPQRSVRMIVQDKKVLTARAKTTVEEAARLMKKHNVGAVMIVDAEDRLVGIFTERDALFRVTAERRDPHTTRVATVMTRSPKTIDPEKPFNNALFMMYEGGFRHVPVVEDGRPLGMISARDALGPEFQEFGEEMLNREHIGEILA
jgi:CBS domain-containing protein